MAQIFISYSIKDAEVADRIHQKLVKEGLDVWVDREDLQGGDLWRRQIVEAIASCSAFVIILSPDSVRSNNTRKELDIAEGKNRRIIPVMISKINIPSEMEYQLAGVQVIDLSSNLEAGLDRLIESLGVNKIASAVGSSSATARPVQVQQGSPAAGTIRLFRLNPKDYSSGEAGNYGVWVDDQKVAKLDYGKEISLAVPVGSHRIYVEWMRFKSNVLQFNLGNNQTIELMCGERRGWFLGTLFVEFKD
jgi:hypothetical protein